MKEVQDRVVQFSNRYKLTNAETGEVLGTFDFDEVTGAVQQVGTEIDAELFQSIADDLAARVKLSGGELAGTIVTFSDIGGTAANVASGDTSATLWGKVKNWFSRLKALAFKNKVAAGDFEAGAIKNADVAADAAIAQSKVSGLMTDYVASISVSGRTVTYKNKNGVDMGSITTQDTTYGLASQSSNGLMSSTDKTKLDGIESGAQKNTVLGVKGGSESAYRTGNVNITKANIGLGNVDNTSDEDKPVSAATQMALNGKANTSGTYLNLTVGKATNADNATHATSADSATTATNAGNVTTTINGKKITDIFEADGITVKNASSATSADSANTATKAETADSATTAETADTATKAEQDGEGNVISSTYVTNTQLSNSLSTKANTSGQYDDLTAGAAIRDNEGNVISSTYIKASDLLDILYPVGSIYMNYANSTSPASTLGGSWTRIYNKFLVGAGSSYTIGSEGGEEFHQLTTAEIPNHTHNTNVRLQWVDSPVSNSLNFTWASSPANLHVLGGNEGPWTSGVGGGQAHNNMPPYRAVWMWRRTA